MKRSLQLVFSSLLSPLALSSSQLDYTASTSQCLLTGACNSASWETEAGDSQVESLSKLQSTFKASLYKSIRPFLKTTQKKTKVELGCSSLVQRLSSKGEELGPGSLVECVSIVCETLGSIPVNCGFKTSVDLPLTGVCFEEAGL